jgi:hypothetical protein
MAHKNVIHNNNNKTKLPRKYFVIQNLNMKGKSEDKNEFLWLLDDKTF